MIMLSWHIDKLIVSMCILQATSIHLFHQKCVSSQKSGEMQPNTIIVDCSKIVDHILSAFKRYYWKRKVSNTNVWSLKRDFNVHGTLMYRILPAVIHEDYTEVLSFPTQFH